MRILLVNGVCDVGGVETWMLSLARTLEAKGHRCELFFLQHGPMEPYLPKDTVVHFGNLAGLIGHVRHERYDIVHGSGSDWSKGLFALREAGARLVVTSHGYADPNWTSRFCDVLVACSNSVAAEHGGHCDIPVHVVANGIDVTAFHPARDAGRREDAPIVAWIGRGVDLKYKRFDRFARVAPLLHRAGHRVWLVEPHGPDEVDRVLPGASERLRPHVEFWGAVPPQRMPALLRSVAASGGCIVSTSASEGLPLSLLEAQACGCPAIGPRVRGVVDAISPEHGGVLYDRDAPADDVARLVTATLRDRDAWQQRSLACSEWVSGGFSLERMADEYLRLYQAPPTRATRSMAGWKARHRLGPLPYWRQHALHRLPTARMLARLSAAEKDAATAGTLLRAALRASPAVLFTPLAPARLWRAWARPGSPEVRAGARAP